MFVNALLNNFVYFSDKIQILALILLPYLFKKIVKQTVRSKVKQNWYPEKEEVLDTFILHIKVHIIFFTFSNLGYYNKYGCVNLLHDIDHRSVESIF